MPPINDNDWVELVAHELPKEGNAVLQTYLKSRQTLMSEEKKQRSGVYLFLHRRLEPRYLPVTFPLLLPLFAVYPVLPSNPPSTFPLTQRPMDSSR